MQFSPGYPVPWFEGRTKTNAHFHFDTVAGRYIVLCFFGSTDLRPSDRILRDFQRHAERFDGVQACFFAVTIDPQDERLGRVQDRTPGIRFFHDIDHRISRQFEALPPENPQSAIAQACSSVASACAKGSLETNSLEDSPWDSSADSVTETLSQYKPFTLVLDERLRILAHVPIDAESDSHVARVMQVLDAQPPIAPTLRALVQAPVLIVPRVFEPDLCRTLIQLYQQHGGAESGFMREVNGKTVGMMDYAHKRRSDYSIEDEAIRTRCMHRIYDRLIPEIQKAFQFKVTRMERYIVSCYDAATGGHFRAHRDNTTKGTAHRHFAVSLNLNSEEFEGGDLRFREFGSHLYRPPTGGAVVFGCSLLHEATPVTSGQRYAFLPFLYDDAAARVRDENLKFLGENTQQLRK
jgi:predicted 2-oxoglutarate/Fe(II)-dependent dioxygenase YbiX/peroxiredoxin